MTSFSLSPFQPDDATHAAACAARDRFWQMYGSPQGPCQALGLDPVEATYVLRARVAEEADLHRLPAVFEGFAVEGQVGAAVPQGH